MFTHDWLKKIQEKYGTSGEEVHISNYQGILDYLRATDNDTPRSMTVGLLRRLLTGTSVDEIERILGLAARYNDLLEMFNYFDDEATQLKEKAAHPAATEEEKEELHKKWEIAWAKRESYWVAINTMAIPMTQICYSIEGKKIYVVCRC